METNFLTGTNDQCSVNSEFSAARRRWMAAGLTVATVGVWPGTAAFAQTNPRADRLGTLMAVNLSGRQRTLALRAARAQAQLALGVLSEPSNALLRSAVADFTQALASLRTYSRGKPAAALFETQARLWRQFNAAMKDAQTKESAAAMNDALEKLVPACSAAHDQVVRDAASQTAVLVMRTGRQRFISQRAAQLFMFREWGVIGGNVAELSALVNESQKIRAELKASTAITEQQKNYLTHAESQWFFLEEAIRMQQRGAVDETAKRNVATTSERLYSIFDRATMDVVEANE